MAHENKVSKSIETPGGDRCVDLFQRPDGTFGFEEYRREIEDGRGWQPIGFYGKRSFATQKATLEDALRTVPWLKEFAGAD